MPASGLQFTHHGQLFPKSVFIQLMFDVIRYLDCNFSSHVNIMVMIPKLQVLVFGLLFGNPFIQLHATLPFQETYHVGHSELGRYFKQHADMVGANLGLNYRKAPFLPNSGSPFLNCSLALVITESSSSLVIVTILSLHYSKVLSYLGWIVTQFILRPLKR